MSPLTWQPLVSDLAARYHSRVIHCCSDGFAAQGMPARSDRGREQCAQMPATCDSVCGTLSRTAPCSMLPRDLDRGDPNRMSEQSASVSAAGRAAAARISAASRASSLRAAIPQGGGYPQGPPGYPQGGVSPGRVPAGRRLPPRRHSRAGAIPQGRYPPGPSQPYGDPVRRPGRLRGSARRPVQAVVSALVGLGGRASSRVIIIAWSSCRREPSAPSTSCRARSRTPSGRRASRSRTFSCPDGVNTRQGTRDDCTGVIDGSDQHSATSFFDCDRHFDRHGEFIRPHESRWGRPTERPHLHAKMRASDRADLSPRPHLGYRRPAAVRPDRRAGHAATPRPARWRLPASTACSPSRASTTSSSRWSPPAPAGRPRRRPHDQRRDGVPAQPDAHGLRRV